MNVRATVSGSNININDTQGRITFSGNGNISGNTLTIIYTASTADLTDNCTASVSGNKDNITLFVSQ